jgi:hypothetical protein
MGKRIWIRPLAVTVMLAFAIFFGDIPAYTAQFTADLDITSPGENYTFKLYVKDNMYRLEKVKGGMRFPPYPTIVNRDTGLTWGLNPQVKQYVEMKEIEKTMMMNPIPGWERMRKGLEKETAGTETVSGYACDKFVYHEPGKT